MDPLTALSLAAAILQFVEAGSKIVKRLSEFSPALDDIPRSFRQVRTELPLIIDGLRRVNEQAKAGLVEPSTEAALLPVVRECLQSTVELNDLLDRIIPSATASTWERRKKAIASLTKDKKVKELAEALEKYVRVLTFHQVTSAPAKKPRACFWFVPFDRNPAFVGRDAVFQAIDRAFNVKTGSQPKASLCGLGGIGKSQIALEYCYRKRLADNEVSVFWVNAATASRFEESFKRIADECGLVNQNDAATDGILNAQQWLQAQHFHWIMVIDNVDDQSSYFHGKMSNGKTPSQCIPRCPHGTLIFTTRNRDIAVDLAAPSVPVMVAELNEKEGLQLVKGRLEDKSRVDDNMVRELLVELEYIPLAITQALAFMSKRRKTVPQYLEQYRKSDGNRSRLLSFDFVDHGKQDGSLESVAKTWSISFESIRENNPRAANLLCITSFFQHQRIPRLLLQDPNGGDCFENDWDVLCDYSFLNADEDQSTFHTHRLVQLATRLWLQRGGPDEANTWAFRALCSLGHHFPDSQPMNRRFGDYWPICQSLLPHTDLLLKHSFENISDDMLKDIDLERARLLANSAQYFISAGAYDEARARLEEALSLRERRLGKSALETLSTMRSLAWLLFIMGEDISSALKMQERTLLLMNESLGPDHRNTIDTLSGLAATLLADGQTERSEELQREAFHRSERVLGTHHNLTLECKGYLADVLVRTGKMNEAVPLLRETYEERARQLGEEHPYVLIGKHNLAMMLIKAPETRAEGLLIIRCCFDTSIRTLGIDHRDTLIMATGIIWALCENNRSREALTLCEKILTASQNGPRRNNKHSQTEVREIEKWRRAILAKLSERGT